MSLWFHFMSPWCQLYPFDITLYITQVSLCIISVSLCVTLVTMSMSRMWNNQVHFWVNTFNRRAKSVVSQKWGEFQQICRMEIHRQILCLQTFWRRPEVWAKSLVWYVDDLNSPGKAQLKIKISIPKYFGGGGGFGVSGVFPKTATFLKHPLSDWQINI